MVPITASMSPPTTPVFVYGTLRKGHHNWRAILAPVTGVEAKTARAAYTMRSWGNFPAVYAGGGTSILGEVFDVPDDILARLDELEGRPTWYKREEVEVVAERGGSGGARMAWMYIMPGLKNDVRGEAIDSGDWNDHVANN
mmetsp:Transcript_59037/g.175543  ORF Transcript_59037/g.175543 Transcript_59037/m.175543 type:complete len:141 (-) Transcript_59037:434-856(-)